MSVGTAFQDAPPIVDGWELIASFGYDQTLSLVDVGLDASDMLAQLWGDDWESDEDDSNLLR